MADRRIVTGEIRKIDKRKEKTAWWKGEEDTIYSFVVERFDEQGNAGPSVGVEIMSKSGFDGLLSEGDQVTFFADKRMPSGALKVGALRNLTTGTLFGERRAVKRGDVPAP